MCPLEQLQEGSLRACRATHATEAQSVDTMIELFDVEQQVLNPERGALAHRRRLSRLEVRVCQRGHRRVFPSEVRECRNATNEPLADQTQSLPVKD